MVKGKTKRTVQRGSRSNSSRSEAGRKGGLARSRRTCDKCASRTASSRSRSKSW